MDGSIDFNDLAVSYSEKIRSPRIEQKIDFEEALTKYKHQPEIVEILQEFEDVFVQNHEYLLPALATDPMVIPLKSTTGTILPTLQMRERHYKQIDVEAIENFVEIGLMNGLLRDIKSPVQNPLHCVRTEKFDESGNRVGIKTRITADCRRNNIKNCADYNYAFPVIDEELTHLTSLNAKYFNSVDLASGFHQIKVAEESVPLFAFPVYDGKYKGRTFAYTRLLFGWKAAPALFSDTMSKIFFNIESPEVKAKLAKYIDDIAFSCETWDDQIKFMRRFLQRCREFNVQLGIKKCQFALPTVVFCGHAVSTTGIQVSEKRVTLLKEYPKFDVKSRKKNADLSLLGFYGYHSKWVNNYSKKDQAIRSLIKDFKSKNITAEKCNAEIADITDSIKKAVLNSVVVTPLKSDVVTLVTDSSGRAWGCSIYCDRGIIAYAAGTFAESIVRTHSIYLLELRALAKAVFKFYRYLVMAGSVILKTDNMSATFCMNQKAKARITTRALQYIQLITMLLHHLRPKVMYLGTKENQLCDALSRLSYDKDGNFTSSDYLPRPELFLGKVNEDIAAVNSVPVGEAEHTTDNSLELSPSDDNVQSCAPQGEKHWSDFVDNVHKHCHWSLEKTLKTFQSAGISIPRKVVAASIERCQTCQNPRKIAPLSKLHPKPTPQEPFHELHMDFVDKKGDRMSRRGHVSILTVICAMSRYAFAFPMKRFTIMPVIDELARLFAIVGRIPTLLYADNAFQFTGLQEFCDSHGITLRLRASHLSRSVMVERFHRTLHVRLHSFMGEYERNWDTHLGKAVTSINTQVSDATGFTPYFLLFGHEHPLTADVERQNKEWQDCKVIAIAKSDMEKQRYTNDTYNFPTLSPGTEVVVKYDPGKNGKKFDGKVTHDEGGAELTVKLQNRAIPIRVHKGMVLVFKGTDGYRQVFNPSTDTTLSVAPHVDNVISKPEERVAMNRYNFRDKNHRQKKR